MKAFLALAVLFFATQAHADGEVSLSLAQARSALLVPIVSLTRESLTYSSGLNDGHETATGVEVGARFLSSSTKARNFFAGVDFRQGWARAQSGGGDVLTTKLGMRLELHPRAIARLGFSFDWFFGDTVVARTRDRQFNGSTFALGTSIRTGSSRILLEGTSSSYKEGPGFILRSREAGFEGLDSWAVKIGVEFPMEIPMPDFFYNGPPS